jgi:hypothetical protein
MGSTCASVHIALTGAIPDAIDGIVRAYRTLGFEPAETASPAGGKHVILLRKEGDAFLSVYDSDNAALDTGELQDLARAASKIFKTAAVCTSLYDSDTFEVVVFNAGRQVDLVMPHPEEYSGPLKRLSDASRAAQWSRIDAVAGLSRLIGLTGGQSQLHYQDLLDSAKAPASATARSPFMSMDRTAWRSRAVTWTDPSFSNSGERITNSNWATR